MPPKTDHTHGNIFLDSIGLKIKMPNFPSHSRGQENKYLKDFVKLFKDLYINRVTIISNRIVFGIILKVVKIDEEV